MFVAEEKNMHRVLGHVPNSLWDRYETWSEGRGKIQMRQLLGALFRLFLAAPEWLKLMALYGKDEDMGTLVAEGFESVDETATDAWLKIKDLVGRIEPGHVKLLGPDEQAAVNELRELLGREALPQREDLGQILKVQQIGVRVL